MNIKNKRIAFALTSSFYTYKNTICEMEKIMNKGGKIIPIMSKEAYNTNSKFGNSKDFIKIIERITKQKIINSIDEAEEKEGDILTICPCSGNHIAKIASSIYDTPVLASARLHLRNNKPVLLRHRNKRWIEYECREYWKIIK